ncbi:protein kinase [Rhodococcus triatomae]|uniref:non-specific serine/threonine protein kinase n=1 Tax=Rhodococcus triatomae TaxID=300028 RepID=A0A1G8HSG4_9NOCA|nr:serine/threonine-protein kinase [Rhodococcus triatomae]QNG20867.1 protein kinase [Rhodococcus triatomae]QNG23218.1 protein kinase [Rhodococcus triatomae]SDI09598.1 non-specific serine/threonine protein kinase/serine/threonine-protein kinase PknK [Rhodococcus triatomae]
MADRDPMATRQVREPDFAAELTAAGFAEPVEVGRGGFGVVYRCEQPELDRVVAVKVLTADLDDDNLERFLREQRAMGRLSGHPNIVTVLHVGTIGSGRPFLVMPFHARGSLEQQIRQGGPLDWSEAIRVGVSMAGALATAHGVGVLHRDVKPANILLTDYGEPQLTDFGIARIAGGFETEAGVLTGSPAFTAPEVLEGGEPTIASDVYSLGATLFCAVTGHAAFERRSGEQVVAQFLRITSASTPRLSDEDIPVSVSAVVADAMAVEPERRIPDARELGERLREAQRVEGLSVHPLPIPDGATVRPSEITGRHPLAPSTAPPTPGTRFRPRRRVGGTVRRRRLLEILDAEPPRLLTLVHGPAGYGKSTLAAQWREVLGTRGVPVSWFVVDRDDANPRWFAEHVLEAVRRRLPDLVESVTVQSPGDDDAAARDTLTALIDAVHDGDEMLVLVIDDWHRAAQTSTAEALKFLLDNACRHLRVVVCSRVRTGLPISRMRVRDEILDIDSEVLRFDEQETKEFLVDVAGLDVDDSDAVALHHYTDGWPAAVQLISQTLSGVEPGTGVGELTGRRHIVDSFLSDAVLDPLEPELVEFMESTSITKRTCAELASAVTGQARAQDLLEEVERRDLFLRRVDEEGRWFRYHPMFREYLRLRLARDHPEQVTELHEHASEWFAEHGYPADAVAQALAAGEQQRAAALVERFGAGLLEKSQVGALLDLAGQLPPALVRASPPLQGLVGRANSLLRRGRGRTNGEPDE